MSYLLKALVALSVVAFFIAVFGSVFKFDFLIVDESHKIKNVRGIK